MINKIKKIGKKWQVIAIKKISKLINGSILIILFLVYLNSLSFDLDKISSEGNFNLILSIPLFIIVGSISITSLTFTYARTRSIRVGDVMKEDILFSGEHMFYSTILYIFGLVLLISSKQLSLARIGLDYPTFNYVLSLVFGLIGLLFILISAFNMAIGLIKLKKILEESVILDFEDL